LSTHYYVLSLSTARSTLLEAFRDSLIEVENQGFPLSVPAGEPAALGREQRRDLARTVDEHFNRYHAREPLRVVVVGAPEMQVAFSSVTTHDTAIIGRIEGDHVSTSARDLGQIVWPVVREAMSGVVHRAMRELGDCLKRGGVVSGLEAVVREAGREEQATLLVEDDFHRRGSIWRASGPPVVTSDVDIRDAMDDVVDAVIERVLESDGSVVFTPPGTLNDQAQIVLLPRSKRCS
jgi:hypothetical protein